MHQANANHRVGHLARPLAAVVLAFSAGASGACSLLHKPVPVDAGPVDTGAPSASVAVDDTPPPPEPVEAGARPRPFAPSHPHAGGGCAGNLVPVLAAAGASPECVLECASDPSCPEGMICDARGSLDEHGKPGKTISYCSVGKRAPGKVDAGVAPAAPSAAPVAKHFDVRKGANGSCPAGYLACGAACRFACKAAADCGLATARCVQGMCEGPGALPCSK